MLISYILLPFIFAFLIGISNFLKNPIYIRRVAKTFFVIQFIYTCILFLVPNVLNFSILNIDFILDKNAQFLLFLNNFIFFLFSIISKTFILKLHKMFYATSFLLLALVNFSILSDCIFTFFLSLFWIILINYFLSISFVKKEEENQVKYQITNDLIWYFIAASLILYDFTRCFILNDIDFTFSNLKPNLHMIEDSSTICAFFGMLIIIAKLFNFIPFNSKNILLSNKINPCVFFLNSITNIILGSFLFLKVYKNFDYLFFQFQDEISIFLIINFIIFAILTLRQKNLFKFLTTAFCTISIVIFFSSFTFEKECLSIFLYSIFILSLSYLLSAFVFIILANKFKSGNLDDFKKIEDKTRLSQIFTTIALLNMASTPLLPIFGFELICLMTIFSTEYEGIILNYTPYCLILGVLIVSLASFSMLYKILIEPTTKTYSQDSFCNHQIIVCLILILALIILGFCPEYLFEQMNLSTELGQF